MQNSHDLETCIVIEDSAYDQFKAEVEALPKRRQKLWKFILLDKWGTKSRLAYKDGKLLNYSLLKHDFVEVIPRRSLLAVVCRIAGLAKQHWMARTLPRLWKTK